MLSPDAGRHGLLARVPLAWTSLLVAALTILAVVLVTLVALAPAPGASATGSRARVAAGDTDSRSPVFVLHPSAPTTTTPPTTSPPDSAAAVPSNAGAGTAPARRPSPPPPSPSTPAPARPILPPSNPSSNLAPSPDFTGVCVQAGFDAGPCISAASQAHAAARAHEGLGPLSLPSDYTTLTSGEQLFVLTDIERVDRGLPPVTGMVQELDQDAQSAAAGNADPTPSSVPPGTTATRWVSNWAEAAGPMGSDYMWLYDDGPGSGNLACSQTHTSSCWAHRDNILGFSAAQISASGGVLVMGAAEVTGGADSPWASDTELIALLTGTPSFTYTWSQAQAAGAR